MIRFSAGSWLSSVLVYYGGVLPKLIRPTIFYSLYVFALYEYCRHTNFYLAADGITLIASSTTFMLVFRLNQCYARLQAAQDMLVQAICSMRELVALTCNVLNIHQIRGPVKEADEQAATMIKVHACRLTIAFAVSLKYHMRVAEMMNNCAARSSGFVRHALSDLVRIKRLLTDVESELLEGMCGLYEGTKPSSDRCGAWPAPEIWVDFNRYRAGREANMRHRILEAKNDDDQQGCAVPPFLVHLLRAVLLEPLGQPWGYPERMLNLIEGHIASIMTSFQGMNQLVMIPLPLPYLQLCKLLLLVFIFAYPLSISLHHGIWGNVIVPTILAMTLYGFEVVADFMENPLGDDSADISMYELIHEFEVEVEALFNASERNRPDIIRSWHELGRHFELQAGCELLTQPSAAPGRRRFTDFFQWSSLPQHTVQYILEQSSEVTAVHSRLCCHHQAGHGVGDSSEEDSNESLEQGLDDIFTIQRCVALRAGLPHLEQARRQNKMLAKTDPAADPSFRNAMASEKQVKQKASTDRGG